MKISINNRCKKKCDNKRCMCKDFIMKIDDLQQSKENTGRVICQCKRYAAVKE